MNDGDCTRRERHHLPQRPRRTVTARGGSALPQRPRPPSFLVIAADCFARRRVVPRHPCRRMKTMNDGSCTRREPPAAASPSGRRLHAAGAPSPAAASPPAVVRGYCCGLRRGVPRYPPRRVETMNDGGYTRQRAPSPAAASPPDVVPWLLLRTTAQGGVLCRDTGSGGENHERRRLHAAGAPSPAACIPLRAAAARGGSPITCRSIPARRRSWLLLRIASPGGVLCRDTGSGGRKR
jgi:hypothetical protein